MRFFCGFIKILNMKKMQQLKENKKMQFMKNKTQGNIE
jgi:hypothetical protein